MKNQVLSIEQMKHLAKLGVNPGKTSICWARTVKGISKQVKGEWFLSIQDTFMCPGDTRYEIVPTLTLQELVNLLPEEYEGRELVMRPRSAYVGYDDTSWYKNRGYLLTSAYELLCEILEDQKK